MRKRNKIKWSLGIFTITLLLIYSAKSYYSNSKYNSHFESPKNRNEAWSQDLSHLQNNYFDLCKSFSKDAIEKANKIIDSIKLNIDKISDNRIKLLISKSVSIADDGHTTAYFGQFETIPLKFYLFDDGLFVTNAKVGKEKYLGAQVIKIADKPIDELISYVDTFISGNKSWVRYKSSYLLTSPDFLEGIGLVDNISSIKYDFLIEEDTLTAYLSAEKKYGILDEFDSWRNLTPSNQIYADTINKWSSITLPKVPLYISEPNIPGFIKQIDSLNSLYIQINTSTEIPNFFKKVKESITINNSQNLIIDLRFNTGGNYIKQAKLSKEIPKLVKGKVFIVVGNATFSAGICTAARLKYFAKDKAIVVGQKIGDRLIFWAEGKRFVLPNSKFEVRVATGFHDWESNSFETSKTFWLNIFYGVPAKDLTPDIPVSNNFNDYVNGTDKILEEIKQYLTSID